MTARPSTAARYLTIALAVFALIVVPTAIYTAGYCWLGKFVELDVGGSALPPSLTIIQRTYPQQWMKIAFRPAANVEGWLRGVLVVVTVPGDHEPAP